MHLDDPQNTPGPIEADPGVDIRLSLLFVFYEHPCCVAASDIAFVKVHRYIPLRIVISEYPFVKIKKDSIYLEKRARVIKLLEKFNNMYHYSEDIFFLSLTYIDFIFKTLYNENKKITKKEEDLYILNCLFISEKFYDKDTKLLPNFELYLDKNIYDTEAIDIRENEISCLRILNYKLDHHSLEEILKA